MATQPKILVVDDSLTMRMIVKAALNQPGWTVLLAVNGKEALEVARANQVDLILSDWNMPVMGGLGFIQGLRELPQYQDVPVLVLTTEEDSVSKMAARELGVTGWVNKPVDPQGLAELVAELLGVSPS
jgi:two-component system chemotaxis response regulator CheY